MSNTETAATDPSPRSHQELLDQLAETEKLLDERLFESEAEPEPPPNKKPKATSLRAATTPPPPTSPEPTPRPSATIAVSPDEATVPQSFANVPPENMTGVRPDIVQLCATISGQIYQENIFTRKRFQDLLKQKIPSGHAGVKVLMYFEPVWDPAITMTRTGATLIIGWRGTQKLQDFLTNSKIETCTPWENLYPYLAVPEAHYNMVDAYFQRWARALTDMISGNFRLSDDDDDDAVDITVPIQEIVLTGHSLGGAIAQIAHIYLTLLPPQTNTQSRLFGLTEALKKVSVRTVCFSAPMTTALSLPPSDKLDSEEKNKTIQFLNKTLAPSMRNIIFSTDVVPRGYANLEFINAFLLAVLRDPASKGFFSWLVDTFVRFHHAMLKSRRGLVEQAVRYFHVAKIIHYEKVNSDPLVFVDEGFAKQGPMTRSHSKRERSFYDLDYVAPEENVAKEATDIHNKIVTGPGLSFS